MKPPSIPARRLSALALAGLLAACGGGEFTESLVRLISARFVPAEATVAPGATRRVQLEVQCDRDALNTTFGRLGIRVRLDPSHLPAGVTATLVGTFADAEGFSLVQCDSPSTTEGLRMTRLEVDLTASAGAAATTARLGTYIEVEPLAGQGSKDNTSAEMAVSVSGTAAPTTPGT
ncbi:MAG TPA: hypothetical protein VF169_17335 [Albitalea sp.]|uniref:hypothetical protein n=1 Tax=Piscinibacter sp. TaxID=1903157 RepID=UPI002ED0DD58